MTDPIAHDFDRPRLRLSPVYEDSPFDRAFVDNLQPMTIPQWV